MAFRKTVLRRGVVICAFATLAACGGGGRPLGPFQGGHPEDNNPPGQETYSQALGIRQKQGCAAAVPILRRYAARGGGFEIAEFELGDCLASEARAASDAGQRQTLTEEALDNLLKAANSNEPNAQGVLADIYFKGDIVAQNKVEAGKWLLLYKRNNLRLNVGARSLPDGLEAAMNMELSADDWQMAQQLADTFTVVVQDTIQGPTDEEAPDAVDPRSENGERNANRGRRGPPGQPAP